MSVKNKDKEQLGGMAPYETATNQERPKKEPPQKPPAKDNK